MHLVVTHRFPSLLAVKDYKLGYLMIENFERGWYKMTEACNYELLPAQVEFLEQGNHDSDIDVALYQ